MSYPVHLLNIIIIILITYNNIYNFEIILLNWWSSNLKPEMEVSNFDTVIKKHYDDNLNITR